MKKILFALIISSPANYAIAQPAVRNEPRHHNVFENEYVRVLDVWLPPNDTTQYHVHATPSVFTTFTKTITSSQLKGGQPVSSVSVAGNSTYDSLVTPRIHRVINIDSTWFHVMDAELVAGKPHADEPALQNTFLHLLFDEPLVRGYHIQLQSNESIQIPASKTGYLLISLSEAAASLHSNGIIQHRFMKPGHYYWIETGKSMSVNADDAAATFTLLQMK